MTIKYTNRLTGCAVFILFAEELRSRGRTPEDAQLPVAYRKGRRPKGQNVRGYYRGVCDLLGTVVFRHTGTTSAIRQSF